MMKALMEYLHYILLFVLLYLTAANIAIHAAEIPKRLNAATLDYPPYEYLEDKVSKGIAVELIQEAAMRVGVEEVTFRIFPWRRAVRMVETGKFDILFNAGKNKARQEWGDYVDSVLILQRYVLFKRKGDDIKIDANFDNAFRYSLGIRAGYLYGSGAFRQALDQKKFAYQIASESTAHNVTLLLHNRIDMFVGDMLPVMHYIKQNYLNDQIDIVLTDDNSTQVVLTWPTYILMSKKTTTPELVQAFHEAMEEMKEDGTYDQIFMKYQ